MTRKRDFRPPAGRPLFGPDELRLRPTGQARLRELARHPMRSATERERRLEEDEATMKRLREQGADLARIFRLRYQVIDPERDGVVEHYGVCYEDGVIRIRLRHAKTDRLLKDSSLVDTLCHELAHLRYLDHSIRFQRLYRRILEKARQLGYYRPGRAGESRPTQLALLDAGACGTVPHAEPRRT